MHNTLKKYVGITLFLSALAFNSNATVIYTQLTPDSITVGDKVQLTYSIVTPQNAKIAPPPIDSIFDEIKVKEHSLDVKQRKNSDSTTFTYIITSYTVGIHQLPKVPFIVTSGNKSDTAYSDSLNILVTSVINITANDTIDIKDIKPPLATGTPSFLWLWIIVGIATTVGLIFWLKYLWTKNKKDPLPPPPISPYKEIKIALNNLDAKGLLTKGLFREYVFELSEIFKRYIGRNFNANVAEYTTDEIISWISRQNFAKTKQHSLEWFFKTTHPVKFAKQQPDSETIKKMLETVVSFVEDEEKNRLKELNDKKEVKTNET